MKRVLIFGSSLALVLACAKTPEAKNAAGDAVPSAAATTGSAAAEATPAGPAAARPAALVPAASAGTADVTPANATTRYREVTLPAGTVLPVDLETPVGSDTSRVEQPVQGRLRHAVVRNGIEVLPPGTALGGYVTAAKRPGRVKGRGYVAMRFTELTVPGEGHVRISTAPVSRMAPATKGKDAIEILAPAAGGAVVGRLVGGKKAAREGALIGGAAGTGYVLSTRGKEVRLGKGANLSVRLTSPVTVRVPAR